jgi:hypothetical protein
VLGERPCLYQAVMCRPAPGAPATGGTRVPHGRGGASASPARRVVTDVAGGRSVFASDGPPARAFALDGSGLAFADLWQTGGPLRDALQGGDLVAPAWSVEPVARGISWRLATLPPERALARADAAASARELAAKAPGFGGDGHHHAARPGLHRTDTLDLILVLGGELELELPGHAPRRLRRGDAVVQRGTWHLWRVVGDEPCTFSAVMIATPPFPDGRIAEP